MSDTIDEIRKLLGENKRLKKPFNCEHHPEVNSSTMWGCPDCLRELREQVRELEAVYEAAELYLQGYESRIHTLRSQLTKAKEAFRLIIDDYHQGRNEGMMVCSAMVSMRCKAEKALTELEDKS